MALHPPRSDFDRRIEPITPAELCCQLDGRIPRALYWRWGVLAPACAGLLGYLLLTLAGVRTQVAESVVTITLLWPSIAITVKRWHDRNRSGWWMLAVLVPVIGPLWTLLQCGFLKGTPGDNRYGPPLPEAAVLQRTPAGISTPAVPQPVA